MRSSSLLMIFFLVACGSDKGDSGGTDTDAPTDTDTFVRITSPQIDLSKVVVVDPATCEVAHRVQLGDTAVLTLACGPEQLFAA